MNSSSTLVARTPYARSLEDELRFALGKTPPSELSAWGKRVGERFVSVGAKRITGFGTLIATITTKSADELSRAIAALMDGKFGSYTKDRAHTVDQLASRIVDSGQSAFALAAKTIESRPSETATHLLAVVVGFYCGSGGDGDGGIPDLDFLAGVGAHRSIFTHSIIAGAFVETAVMSLLDLVQVIHARLPPGHSAFWDSMLRHAEIGGSTFVSAASIGIATHLGVDTLVDGFTPYKDLPIELPKAAHEILMGLNAGVEGVHGARRYAQDLGQFENTPPAPVSTRVELVVEGDANVERPLLQLPGSENGMAVPNNAKNSTAPTDEFSPVEKSCDRIEVSLGIDTNAIKDSIALARRRIDQAKGPFRLGVVGEFRVGKSTLVNALIGQEVAFTDFMEATPVVCRFTKGPELEARILHKDGQTWSATVAECNAVLDQRRHDKEWAASVEHVEYQVPVAVLDSYDLWDAPGLGGSDDNDSVAQHYIDMLGGAIWVVDATLIGRAAIAGPIARMHSDGKPIICVLNRIDETKEDPEALKKWIADAYPGIFSETLTFSAQVALDSSVDGTVSKESQRLWDAINRAIGVGAEAGSSTRSSLVSENARALVASKLVDLARDVQDRVGAMEHWRAGLEEAKERTLLAVTDHLERRADPVFSEIAIRVEGILAKQNWSTAAIDEVIARLSDSKMLSEVSRRLAEEALDVADQTWRRTSDHALALSAAAVPLDNLVFHLPAARDSSKRDALAIDHGVYIGGLTAIATGTLAAISTIVTWPVILAAIPVGALATWKKRKEIRASDPDLMREISDLIAQMKRAYLEKSRPEIESRVAEGIQSQLDDFVAQKRRVLLNGCNSGDAETLRDDLLARAEELSAFDRATTKSEWSGKEMLEALGNPGTRLDIVTEHLDFSLAPILSELPAGTEVRLVFNAQNRPRNELERCVTGAFESWPGRKRIKAVSGSGEFVLDTILMTQDRCFTSASSLAQLLESGTSFREFEGGRLAGQHLFACLWEGAAYKGVAIETTPIH